MQTRSMTSGKRLTFANKLFNFPIIDNIEKKIRKMNKLSKSSTFTTTVHDNDNEDASYEKILTTTVTFPAPSKEQFDASGFDTPPPLPSKPSRAFNRSPPKPPREFNRSPSSPPKPPREFNRSPSREKEEPTRTIGRNLMYFARTAFIWFFYAILLIAVIGGLCACQQQYQTWNRDETTDVRYQSIVLDQKTMTYKFVNLKIE